MATYIQRWQALGEALLGKPATVAQLTRLGAAVGKGNLAYSNEAWAALTNAQQAELCVKFMYKYVVGQVKNYEQNTAVATAINSVGTAVDTDLAETVG